MANRTLAILLHKIHKNGDIDKIFFKNRAKDVIVNEDTGETLVKSIEKLDNIQESATKTEKSATNGNIKINGSEVQVYKHGESGVRPGTYNSVVVDARGHVTSGTTVNNWTGSVSGEISNAITKFTTANGRVLPATGESNKTIFGKITKFLTDLKTLAFTDKVGTSNLDTTLTTFYNKRVTTDNVTTSTSITAAGWIADARAIASLQNQINTINSNKANSNHNHDSRYYTESEMNTKLNGKQNSIRFKSYSATINSTYVEDGDSYIRQWGAVVFFQAWFRLKNVRAYTSFTIMTNLPPALYSADCIPTKSDEKYTDLSMAITDNGTFEAHVRGILPSGIHTSSACCYVAKTAI